MGSRGWRTQDGRDLVLSERQREVLELIARGRTNAEIGEALGISLDGAKWHVSEIIAKLGVADRDEAVAAWRHRQRTGRRFPTYAWRWPIVGAGALSIVAAAGVVFVLAGIGVR